MPVRHKGDEAIRGLLRRTSQSEFVRHNAIFFVGSLAVGALNYAYYPVLGRLMPPATFGEVQTLASLFLQLTIFLNVLSMVTVNIVANAKDEHAAQQLIVDFEKIATLVSVVLLLGSLVTLPWLQHFLQFTSGVPFVALGLALVVSVPFTFRTAYLRGRQRFAAVSVAMVIGSAAKLMLSTALVVAGLSTAGAMFGIVGAQVVALAYALYCARRAGFIRLSFRAYATRLPNVRRLRPELGFALLVLAVSLAITLQYSVDIVVVKHYFSPHTAGLYAGVASVARIIFFLTASIAQVMLPAVKLVHSPRKNRMLLIKSAVLLAAVGGPAWAGCVVFPNFVMRVLMGNGYSAYAHLLPGLASAVLIISVLNLAMAYFTALRKPGAAIVGIMGSAVTFCLMLLHHSTLSDVVSGLLYGSVAMICMLAIWVGGTKLKANARYP